MDSSHLGPYTRQLLATPPAGQSMQASPYTTVSTTEHAVSLPQPLHFRNDRIRGAAMAENRPGLHSGPHLAASPFIDSPYATSDYEEQPIAVPEKLFFRHDSNASFLLSPTWFRAPGIGIGATPPDARVSLLKPPRFNPAVSAMAVDSPPATPLRPTRFDPALSTPAATLKPLRGGPASFKRSTSTRSFASTATRVNPSPLDRSASSAATRYQTSTPTRAASSATTRYNTSTPSRSGSPTSARVNTSTPAKSFASSATRVDPSTLDQWSTSSTTSRYNTLAAVRSTSPTPERFNTSTPARSFASTAIRVNPSTLDRSTSSATTRYNTSTPARSASSSTAPSTLSTPVQHSSPATQYTFTPPSLFTSTPPSIFAARPRSRDSFDSVDSIQLCSTYSFHSRGRHRKPDTTEKIEKPVPASPSASEPRTPIKSFFEPADTSDSAILCGCGLPSLLDSLVDSFFSLIPPSLNPFTPALPEISHPTPATPNLNLPPLGGLIARWYRTFPGPLRHEQNTLIATLIGSTDPEDVKLLHQTLLFRKRLDEAIERFAACAGLQWGPKDGIEYFVPPPERNLGEKARVLLRETGGEWKEGIMPAPKKGDGLAVRYRKPKYWLVWVAAEMGWGVGELETACEGAWGMGWNRGFRGEGGLFTS